MISSRGLAACVGAVLLAAPVGATDLTKVDRTITKEPTYKNAPQYCLLVFGPKAETRVWLVLDGDTLYVDRNGNGDLTEPGEAVAAEKIEIADKLAFNAGDIADGPRMHKRLSVELGTLAKLAERSPDAGQYLAKDPQARCYCLEVETEMPALKAKTPDGRVRQVVPLRDAVGFLQFAAKPKDAPIVHFGGPLQIGLLNRPTLIIGWEKELTLGVGTSGLGPGTTAYISYPDVIPDDVHPKVNITYPPQPGAGPPKELHEFKDRC